MKYIYLNFQDLSEEKQNEIMEIVADEVKAETTQEEADNLNMTIEDLIQERGGGKLMQMSHEGRFVFNV